MTAAEPANLRNLPSVDAVLRAPSAGHAVARFGRAAAIAAVRRSLGEARAGCAALTSADAVAADALSWLEADAQPSLRAVFNLTGTVLHTNLGRAVIAEEAVEPPQPCATRSRLSSTWRPAAAANATFVFGRCSAK
jgi:L-seryl-tRNA(Ser) seleniumtransferase